MNSSSMLLLVAFGGALGAVARFGLVFVAAWVLGTRFPYGTLLVNALGCLVIGIAAASLVSADKPDAWTHVVRYGLIVGFLGAFTTFSTFSYETLQLLEAGDAMRALGNVVLSVLVCLLTTWLGMRWMRW
jgi:CrcB protein